MGFAGRVVRDHAQYGDDDPSAGSWMGYRGWPLRMRSHDMTADPRRPAVHE
jgi:hypothetical protein